MNRKWPLVISFALFLGVVTYINYFSVSQYAKQSRQLMDLCLNQRFVSKEPPIVCTHIQLAADSAYFSLAQLVGGSTTIILLLTGGVSVLGYRMMILRKELDELKSKTDA